MVQIQSICRRQVKCSSNDGICFKKVRKQSGKRRKYLVPASSPLPTMFSKTFYVRFINPLPHNKILDHTKLKAFADDKSFLSLIEKKTLWEKEKLLFPQCFQKTSFPYQSKGVILWEWVKTQDCVVKSSDIGHYITKCQPDRLTNSWCCAWQTNTIFGPTDQLEF